MVMSAITMILIACQMAFCLLPVLVLGRPLDKKLDRDPENQHAADELHIADTEQLGHEERQDHAQQDRRGGAEENAFFALVMAEGSGPPWR